MDKVKALVAELFMFGLIQLLGIYAATRLLVQQPELYILPQIPLMVFAGIFLVSVSVMFIAMHFLKHKFSFKLLFVFLIIIGSQTLFSAFFSNTVTVILSLAVVALWIALPYVAMHNIAIILAIAGISTELGFSLSISTVLFLFGILSIYDVIAVYQTKHMIKMFTGLMDRGLLLSLIVPMTRSWFDKTSEVKPKSGFMLLGTGDVAFPLIFAVAVSKISIVSSLSIAAGATIGAALVYYMLITQSQPRAIPALPPIALCSIAAFVASLYI
ncbi:hypothetical protein HOD83_02365 [Candidatus Woesearchaeota archaeon]|jgi:presenilin-like A22 family membrane protease|nr:hypothetical protein [Candidatus Woesearchaeota archaeon]MBT4114147.1 hypothetical protein [Candidatus Woesearchaeota archaeon]MBT4248410.1 hypothetical protein [Candidatus Woesearchaeota archaeon]